jgi:hypothetical protein
MIDTLALLRALTLRLPPPTGSKHQLTLDDEADELDVTVFFGVRWYRFGLETKDAARPVEETVEEIAALVSADMGGGREAMPHPWDFTFVVRHSTEYREWGRELAWPKRRD